MKVIGNINVLWKGGSNPKPSISSRQSIRDRYFKAKYTWESSYRNIYADIIIGDSETYKIYKKITYRKYLSILQRESRLRGIICQDLPHGTIRIYKVEGRPFKSFNNIWNFL